MLELTKTTTTAYCCNIFSFFATDGNWIGNSYGVVACYLIKLQWNWSIYKNLLLINTHLDSSNETNFQHSNVFVAVCFSTKKNILQFYVIVFFSSFNTQNKKCLFSCWRFDYEIFSGLRQSISSIHSNNK